jgi:uncharacterized protein YbaP (TraB family)
MDITREDVSNGVRERRMGISNIMGSLSKEEIIKTFETLSKVFQDFAQQAEQQNVSQEQFISITLQKLKSQIFKKMNLSSGIDLELIKQVKAREMPVDGLETLDK